MTTVSSSNRDYISDLPPEALAITFSHLPISDLSRLGRVSRHFDDVIKANENAVLQTVLHTKSLVLTNVHKKLISYPKESNLFETLKTYVMHRGIQVDGGLRWDDIRDFAKNWEFVRSGTQPAELLGPSASVAHLVTKLTELYIVYHRPDLDELEANRSDRSIHSVSVPQFDRMFDCRRLARLFAHAAGLDVIAADGWCFDICMRDAFRDIPIHQHGCASGHSLPDYPLTLFRSGLGAEMLLQEDIVLRDEAKRVRQSGCCTLKELSEALRMPLPEVPGDEFRPFAYCVSSAEAYGTVKDLLVGKNVPWRQRARVLDELHIY